MKQMLEQQWEEFFSKWFLLPTATLEERELARVLFFTGALTAFNAIVSRMVLGEPQDLLRDLAEELVEFEKQLAEQAKEQRMGMQ